MVIVVMGVSGCGKSTLGQKLAQGLGLPFHDADDYHSVDNVNKMKNAVPLTEEDRLPWLNKLSALISEWEHSGGAVLACSALRNAHRTILRRGSPENVRFVYLRGDKNVIRRRLEQRSGHFMNPELLESQFETLEEPGDALVIPVERGLEEKLFMIISQLNHLVNVNAAEGVSQ